MVESPDLLHGWRRLDGVDILRGLAILFVLMNHVNMRLVTAKIPYAEGLPGQLLSSLVWMNRADWDPFCLPLKGFAAGYGLLR